MVQLTSLWLPILVSAAAIFFLSFLMWMVLPHHRKDYAALPDEDGVMSLLRGQHLAPGLYMFPHCKDHQAMKDPEWVKKQADGPSGTLTVMPPGACNMGSALGKWFLLLLVICTVAAYAATIALPAGTGYMTVFRVIGTVMLLAFCSNVLSDAIWKSHPIRPVLLHVFDGVIYALVAGGIFGWLWPAANVAA